jgi:hypothetical protein
LNSFKDKYYTISADTSGSADRSQRTRVNITTHVDLIPWSPIGINQNYKITVELAQKGAAQKVIIDTVQIQLWRNLNEESTKFRLYRLIWSTSPGDELTEEGQKKVYEQSFALTKDYGLVGLLSFVEITFVDENGDDVDPNLVSNLAEVNPESPEMSVSMTINIRVLNEEQTTKLMMLFISFPLSIVSLILLISGLILFLVIFRNPGLGRKAGYIILAAGIIQILAVLFLFLGIENLVEVLEGVLPVDLRENYVWYPIVYVMVSAGITLIIAAILILIFFKKPKKEVTETKKPEPLKSKEDTFKVIKPDPQEPTEDTLNVISQ